MAKRELMVEMLLNDGEMRTRGCKAGLETLLELEMLLEDDETKNVARNTVKRCSKTSSFQNDSYPTAPCALAEILPETTVRA